MLLAPQALLPVDPFTRAEARSLGVGDRELDRLIESGLVRRVLRSVFQRSDQPDTLVNRVKAVRLVMKPFMVVCDRTAAWVHGVDVFAFWELELLPPIELLARRGNTRPRRKGCAGGTRDLIDEDLCLVDDVLITTPVRTAMDLGASLKRRDALAALDVFMRICGVTHDDLYEMLPRFAGRRGVIQLRELIPLATHKAESPGESWTRLAIIDAGMPAPTPQLWVLDGGRRKFRVDLAYEKCKVVVEYDGEQFHESAEQRAHDEARREWLRKRGWTVIVVNRDSFSPDALAAWLFELRRSLPTR
jgi:hypothetical protein